MPLPKPKKKETKTQFISRFMSDEIAIREFPDESQRFAVAQFTWKKNG
jgi:hypothetical protein